MSALETLVLFLMLPLPQECISPRCPADSSFQDGTGSLRAGIIAFQRDKVGFNVTGRQGGSLLCGLCLCFLRGFAHGLCGILGEVFPAQVKGGLHGWQRPDDHRRQREEQLVRKQCQPQRKACRRCKRQGMPAPRHFPPAHGTSPLLQNRYERTAPSMRTDCCLSQ